MVERTRSLWKRQTVLNRDKLALPAYDVMHDEPSDDQAKSQFAGRAPYQQISKLIVHAPSDPGMLSYISQPAKSSNDAGSDEKQHHSCKPAATPASADNRPRHRRTGTWSQPASQQGRSWHERSGSAGFPSAESSRQAAESALQTAFSWPPPVLPPSAPVSTPSAQAPHQQSEEANLISWDEPECAQKAPAPDMSNMSRPSQAIPVQQQQQRTSQHGQMTSQTQRKPMVSASSLHEQTAIDSHPALSQAALSTTASASDSYEAALALVPKRDLFATITAAPTLPERLPAFALRRDLLVPERSFEQSAVW